MSLIRTLEFNALPLRTGVWVAEVTNLRYTIFQSSSGFIVDCQHFGAGASGNTPIGGLPRGFYPTYQAAVDASNAHHQSLTH